MKDPTGPHGALFRRLILSSHDLSEAAESHARLLELDAVEVLPADFTPDAKAHVARLVTAYARPFTKTRHTDAEETPPTVQTLPGRLLRSLSSEERAMHDRLLQLRNEEFAHSAADAAAVHVSVVKDRLATISAIWRSPRQPFSHDEMDTIGECIRKLRDAITAERRTLEPKIAEALR